MSQTYRVHLRAFEGPLDLLLYLIRKAEVDVHDIPIATITDQYLEHLEGIERIDIDTAGEFLVMAATLMEIKSRFIQPPEAQPEGEGDPEAPEGAGEDPRAELVRQLLEYRKHRSAADALEARREAWAGRSPVHAGTDSEQVSQALAEMGDLEMDDLDVLDLAEAFRAIVSSVNFDRLGDHAIVSDDTPIEIHAEDIVSRLADAGGGGSPGGRGVLTLRQLLEGRTRAEMVGLFLALLTLVRDQRVKVSSEDGEVSVGLGDTEAAGLDADASETEPRP